LTLAQDTKQLANPRDKLKFQIDQPVEDRDWLAFFRDLYLGFGPPDELILRCVRRAYRDFNRTWHGARDPAGRRNEVRGAAEVAIVDALTALRMAKLGQSGFDRWHSVAMKAVMFATDPEARGTGLTLGQAQKWINMSVKYVVGGRVDGFDWVEAFAHVPIDRILIAQIEQHPDLRIINDTLPPGAWSKLTDESAYLAFQKGLRNIVSPLVPLSVEFRLWSTAVRSLGNKTRF
jgi:hypothetical protein